MAKVTKKRKYPKWWTKKTREEQEAYIKAHKHTKMRVTKKRAKVDTKSKVSSLLNKVSSLPKTEGYKISDIMSTSTNLTKTLPAEVVKFIDTKPEVIKKEIDATLTNLERGIEEKVAKLPSKDKSEIGKAIKKAVTSGSVEDAVKAASITLLKLGLVTVGVAAAASIGVPVAFSMLALYEHSGSLKNKLEKLPINSYISSYVGTVFDGIREGIQDKKKLRKAAVNDTPDIITDDEENDAETSSATTTNATDLIKAFLRLNKVAWHNDYAAVNSRKSWSKVFGLLQLKNRLEKANHEMCLLKTKFTNIDELSYATRTNVALDTVKSIWTSVDSELASIAKSVVTNDEAKELAFSIAKQLNLRPNRAIPYIASHNGSPYPVYKLNLTGQSIFIGTSSTEYLIGSTKSPMATPYLEGVSKKTSAAGIVKNFIQ